eukprot:TRINITY_DN6036_c3_g1_i1.p2 TRINITY_DN6036_c3_g1~~TRINITY_DN6036_c3_g1_i1.p2  ORF type:complete len:157 (+),score=46.77 TRINITY_DN6036_c3_g1_i1:66-473(+)
MAAAALLLSAAAFAADAGIAGGLATASQLQSYSKRKPWPDRYKPHLKTCPTIFPITVLETDNVEECIEACDEMEHCVGVDWCLDHGHGKPPKACSLKPEHKNWDPFMPTKECPGGCDCKCDWYEKIRQADGRQVH